MGNYTTRSKNNALLNARNARNGAQRATHDGAPNAQNTNGMARHTHDDAQSLRSRPGGRRNHEKIIIRDYHTRFAKQCVKLRGMHQGEMAVSFLNRMLLEDDRYPRVCTQAERMMVLLRIFNAAHDAPIPIEKATRRQCEDVMASILSRDYCGATKKGYASALMKLVHYAKTGEMGSPDSEYAEAVSWIRPSKYMDGREATVSSEDLLTPDEISAFLGQITRRRDRALFWVLIEGAFRVGELMQMRVGGVDFREDHVIVTTHGGKTGSKRVPLVLSFRPLMDWLADHPARGDPEAPLWYSANSKRTHVISYGHLSLLLRKYAAAAGIKKRVWLYLLRHTQLTLLAKKLSDQTLHVYGNWTRNSVMSRRYVHLSNQDVTDAILEMHGLAVRSEPKTISLSKCPRCNTSNTPDTQRCADCGYILDKNLLAGTMTDDERIQKLVNEGIEKILGKGENLDKLAAALRKSAVSEKSQDPYV